MSEDSTDRSCGCGANAAGDNAQCQLPAADLDARIGRFATLFRRAYIDRSLDGGVVVWRLRNLHGVEAESLRLAELERACCGGLSFEVSSHQDEVVWRISGPRGALLDAFYELPIAARQRRPAGMRTLLGIGAACAACCAAPFALAWAAPLLAAAGGSYFAWGGDWLEWACTLLLVLGAVLGVLLVRRVFFSPTRVQVPRAGT